LWLGLRALGLFTLITLFFILTDRLVPEWQPDGQIIVKAIGFLILARFFGNKRTYLERYGELAIPGLAFILATVAHCAYLPGLPIPGFWWKDLLRHKREIRLHHSHERITLICLSSIDQYFLVVACW
jgi:hypothetical protein